MSSKPGVSPWREAAILLMKQVKEYFDFRTSAWLTNGGKINLGAGVAGFTGVLPPALGGTGTNTGALRYTYVHMTDSAGTVLVASDGTPLMVRMIIG